ncbi:MAG: thiolase family protein [Pseudomonadota bacterium]|nr:thiolase family protein [Pseudomonadota bacterium]
MPDEIVICAARRTPIGAFLGAFSAVPATELGAVAVRAVLEDSGIDPARIDEVLMGCVLPAGLGQAPARQAALKAGIPIGVPCTTVNKMCGSGMKALMLGFDQIRAGAAEVVVAGGMESMSRAPYLVPRAQRMGHARLLDHMSYDGLEDPDSGELMGFFAEQCADRFRFTRQQQDAYAAESVQRSLCAIADGAFRAEIVPVEVKGNLVSEDEGPGRLDLTRIARLKPAFRKDGGTVTAANASSISDGAAALLVMAAATARKLGLPPLARILAHATVAQAPAAFTTAPIGAIRRLLDRLGWGTAEADLYEINEAFAAVALAAIRELGLRPERVNVHGGACALGHPIGATGARILVTLLHALRARGQKRGVASLCIGGGEATALAIEC